jgi:hypothetical protein
LGELSQVLKPLLAFGFAVILGATIIGQVAAGRFPAWRDLVLGALLVPMVGAALMFCFYLATLYFKVYVSAGGLRCYTTYGAYRTVAWDRIRVVERVMYSGFEYLAVREDSRSATLTVPTWLADMEGFRIAVEEFAGPENPLSVALRGGRDRH